MVTNQDEKKQLYGVMIIMLFIGIIILLNDYLIYNRLVVHHGNDMIQFVSNYAFKSLHKSIRLWRFLVLALIFGVLVLAKLKPLKSDDTKLAKLWPVIVGLLVCSSLFILGYTKLHYYNILLYPIIFIANFPLIGYLCRTVRKSENESNILGANSDVERNEMSITFETDKGPLTIHAPQQGIYIEGGAGAGKSWYIIEKMIYQFIEKGYAAYIYDYKGNPATLGKTAYSAMVEAQNKNIDIKVTYASISFTDLLRTVQINPLHPRYIPSKTHINQTIYTLMKNLNKEWISKMDYWGTEATNLVIGVTLFLKNNHPEFCTLPHVVEIILTDEIEPLFNMLVTDPIVVGEMASIVGTYKLKATNQLAGILSAAQSVIKKIRTEEIYWVLSSDSTSLDINNKEKPMVLTVANDPVIEEALSPVIALITSIVMKQINQQGKTKTAFIVDELPTIYIDKIDKLPAEARSNKIVTVLAVQTYDQLIRDYNKDNAGVIIGNLGNKLIGMTATPQTAELVVKMIGDYRRTETSYTESDSGTSETTSVRNDKVIQIRDVMSQKSGHFIGKITDGEPPFFSCNFEKKVMPMHEIPAYASLLKDKTEQENRDLIQEMAKRNFNNIIQQAANIIASYKPAPMSTID